MPMTADDCLANFSVAALMGAPNAVELADAAIEDYLEPYRHAPLGATSALHDLQDAFTAMKIDSTAARQIRDLIDERIHGVSQGMLTAAERAAAHGAEANVAVRRRA